MGRFALPAIVVFGFLIRLAYAAAIYDPSLLPYHYGDWTEYALAAEQIASGDLSFTSSYFVVRPPLFPLLIAALDMRPSLIIALNIIIASGIIPVTYALARLCGLSRQFALLAALLLALDPTSVKYSGVMLAEPLANILLALAFLSLAALRRTQPMPRVVMLGAGGGGINCAFRAYATRRLLALDSDGLLDCRDNEAEKRLSGSRVRPARLHRRDRVETA